jgi:hypothetical protein
VSDVADVAKVANIASDVQAGTKNVAKDVTREVTHEVAKNSGPAGSASCDSRAEVNKVRININFPKKNQQANKKVAPTT